jgi:hypothetical protein
MEENVKNQLDAISNAIDSKIEKSNSQVMADATKNASEIIKGEVSGLVSKFNERMDAMEVANKKQFSQTKPMSFKSALAEALEGGAIEALTKGNSRSASLTVKADMTVAADFTGEVIPG